MHYPLSTTVVKTLLAFLILGLDGWIILIQPTLHRLARPQRIVQLELIGGLVRDQFPQPVFLSLGQVTTFALLPTTPVHLELTGRQLQPATHRIRRTPTISPISARVIPRFRNRCA